MEQLRFTWKRYADDCVCVTVPDPPQNLQLSIDNAEDGTVLCSWNHPDKAHGLIREYIVSEKPSVLYRIYQHILISNQLVCLQVEYSEKDSAEWYSQRSTITNAEVKNLQPSSLYRFRVRHSKNLHDVMYTSGDHSFN